MEHTKTKGYTLMLHHFGQQLTKDAAVSIAEVYQLPSSIVDEIERNHPGRSLIKALKQNYLISEDPNKLKEFRDTLKQMNYLELANIIENYYTQLKQDSTSVGLEGSIAPASTLTADLAESDFTALPASPHESKDTATSPNSNPAGSLIRETTDVERPSMSPEGIQASGKTEKASTLSSISFQEYLKRSGLNGQYPAKMTLKMATRIRILDRHHPGLKQTDIPLLFLTMLTSLDCRVVLPEVLNLTDSVRDFICALLHCSDDFLRQHILEKLAACQLAVPIIIPHPTWGAPTFLLWALRRIVKKWMDDKDSLTPERNMVTEPLFTVAFLRIGKLPVSKSHILNSMFGRAQNNATVAYFISRREDFQEDATFSKGSLEAHWYVPLKRKCGEILNEVTLFLNLRGDSKEFPRQVTFASKVANMVFILIDKECEPQNKTHIDKIQHFVANAVIVSLKERMQKTSSQRRAKLTETNNRLEYEVDGEDIVLSKKLCELIKTTSHGVNSKEYQCIEDWSKICRSLDEHIIVDEDNPSCINATKKSEEIFKQMNSLTVQQLKEQHMTLQKLELEWVKCDQNKGTRNKGHTIEIQNDKIRKEKSEIRKKQLSCGLTPAMHTFYHSLYDIALEEDTKNLHYFMAYFQAQIDKMAQKAIPTHITKIKMLENELAEKKLKLKKEKREGSKDILEKDITKLQEELLRESKEYAHKHIGFEHFMRELSHIFEARILDPQSNLEETQMIAALAARLLIKGYPLELLDGDTTYISITWISNVLSIVDKILNSPKIFAIAVIGVQSSGKSTLLNCMFGVRFAVRAGKCTSGLFMQLLEVDDTLQESLGFQYLLIIDTEGLQSPDRRMNNDFKFDNALATLAMCVVDLSILNISQETIGTDVIGILQIAAHALIRMKKVKLVSRCRIVHQRVSDVNAAGENKISMNIIKDALDKATLAAAKEENIEGIKEFSDVFPFTEKDNLYVPCLWMGNMSPPNHAYSETILNLKSQILLNKGGKEGTNFTQFTLKKFQNRLEDVWDALKKEDFVFNFQNSFNALSYQRFRLEHNKWVGMMRTTMVEWELINKENVKEGNKEIYYRDLKKEINRNLDKMIKEIDDYVSTHSEEDEVKRQQNSFKISSETIAREIEGAIKDYFMYVVKTKREKASLPNFMENCKIMLRDNAKQKALEVLREDPNLDPKASESCLDHQFEGIWEETIEQIKQAYENTKVKEEVIISACENSLSTLIENTQYHLKFQQIIAGRGEKVSKVKSVVVQNESETKQKKRTLWKRLTSKSAKVVYTLLKSNGEQEIIERDRAERIKRLVDEEVNTFKDDKRFEAFDKIHIDKFFTALVQKLIEHKQLADSFALAILVDTSYDIASLSIEKQRQFEGRFSLYKLMEGEKPVLKSDFLSFFDTTITIERVAEKTYLELLAKIRDTVVDHLNVKLLERLRELNCFVDKQILIGTILSEICYRESEQGYLNFVSNQESYIKQWLQEKVIEEVTKKENSQLWIERVASEKVLLLTQIIKNCLQKTQTFFEKETLKDEDARLALTNLSGIENLRMSKERSITVSNWQKTFVDMCKEEHLVIDLKPMIFDSIHYMRFTEMIIERIKKISLRSINLSPELKSCGDPIIAKELISNMEISPYLDILKHVQGCSHVCPFCKVGCHRQGEHSKHAAILHYPQGVAGFRYERTKELVVEICTSLVASDVLYRFKNDEEKRPYKDYQSEFPTWDIRPIPKDEPNKHWQWVMARFNECFAKDYGTEPGVIPDGWKALTKDEALSSLKQFYNLD